jgi:hypothetical protein
MIKPRKAGERESRVPSMPIKAIAPPKTLVRRSSNNAFIRPEHDLSGRMDLGLEASVVGPELAARED